MEFRYEPQSEKLIVQNATRTEYHQLDLWLTRNPKGYRFTPAFKAGYWDGKDSVFNNGRINQGLWKECLKACQVINAKFSISNKEEFPINRNVTLESVQNFCKDFFKNHKAKKDGEWVPFMPYDHQIETAYKVLKNRYCLAEVATSGGKSLIISIVFFYTLKNVNPDAKMLLIVPSISLVTQFFDDIKIYFYGQNNILNIKDFYYEIELYNGEFITRNSGELYNNILVDNLKENKEIKKIRKLALEKEIRIEEIMSDRPRLFSNNPNVYIGTYQSLVNYPNEFFHQFHTVACDESHTAKSKSLKSILSKTFGHAYNRYGVSGTFPTDETMEILTIQSVLGPIITSVEAKTLIEKGIITQMDIKVLLLNHNDREFNDKVAYIKKQGGGQAAYLLEKDYIHVSDKRLNFIKKIVEKCNNNTLILFHTIEYGKSILNKLQTEITDKEFYYIDGEVNGKKREEIKKQMELNDGKVRILVASFGTLSTGVSIKNLFNIIFADSFKSEQIIIQSVGRSLRLFEGKKTANIFDLVDIFDSNPNNIFYKQFLERESFYNKRTYPYKILKINL
jgi:superfamily II DNA or RNA helicase